MSTAAISIGTDPGLDDAIARVMERSKCRQHQGSCKRHWGVHWPDPSQPCQAAVWAAQEARTDVPDLIAKARLLGRQEGEHANRVNGYGTRSA